MFGRLDAAVQMVHFSARLEKRQKRAAKGASECLNFDQLLSKRHHHLLLDRAGRTAVSGPAQAVHRQPGAAADGGDNGAVGPARLL